MTEAKETPGAEPDEEHAGDATDDSTPAEPRIVPARTGSGAIWKSVIGATGGFGCERETFYRETVRNPDGYRLDFGMGEPGVFGIGVDRLHRALMEDRWAGRPMDIDRATTTGYEAARARKTDHRWEPEEWDLLADRLHLAAEKLAGSWPNRVNAQGVAQPEPDGTPPGPPITWLDPPEGVTVEPQVKLHAPDVVGGRGITGQPDYVYRDAGVFVGWADIKALSKAGSFPAKWAAGEAVAYDYLLTYANGGEVPLWHTYLEYRRVMKPYWAVVNALVADTTVLLARSYFARWERALDYNDPDVLSFAPRSCAKCEYRLPMPDLGFGGCAIGEAVIGVIPLPEEDGDGG